METVLQPKIFVDERERSSGVADHLIKLGAYIEFKMLEIGDYLFGDQIVERKRIDDLVRSVFDKRIFDQIKRASEVYDKIFVIIEGSPRKIRELTDRWKAVYGALAFIAQQNNVSILYTSDVEETAYLIFSLASKINARSPSRDIERYTPAILLCRLS
jgi:DNA excision repair protein ERCC-4